MRMEIQFVMRSISVVAWRQPQVAGAPGVDMCASSKVVAKCILSWRSTILNSSDYLAVVSKCKQLAMRDVATIQLLRSQKVLKPGQAIQD